MAKKQNKELLSSFAGILSKERREQLKEDIRASRMLSKREQKICFKPFL